MWIILRLPPVIAPQIFASANEAAQVFRPMYMLELSNEVSHNDLILIQDWCRDNQCGRRMSYDTFDFRSEDEITMFQLRWSGQ